jgi:ferredoxin-like protein FixX
VMKMKFHKSKYLIPQVNSLCPIHCYTVEQNKVMIQYEGCVECVSYSKETNWEHPRVRGVNYGYG